MATEHPISVPRFFLMHIIFDNKFSKLSNANLWIYLSDTLYHHIISCTDSILALKPFNMLVFLFMKDGNRFAFSMLSHQWDGASWWRHQKEPFSALLTLFCGESTGSPVDSPHKGQCRGALISLIRARTNGWANNRDAGDLRRHRAHYGVTVMRIWNYPFSVIWLWKTWAQVSYIVSTIVADALTPYVTRASTAKLSTKFNRNIPASLAKMAEYLRNVKCTKNGLLNPRIRCLGTQSHVKT